MSIHQNHMESHYEDEAEEPEEYNYVTAFLDGEVQHILRFEVEHRIFTQKQ